MSKRPPFSKAQMPDGYWQGTLVDGRFIKGLELFNEGKLYDCHEVIEDLWLNTKAADPYRDLYKGVIQAAAAIYQFERGIFSGALGLYQTSVNYLAQYEPQALGLETTALIHDLKKCFHGPAHSRAKEGNCRFDRSRVPQLQFGFEKSS